MIDSKLLMLLLPIAVIQIVLMATALTVLYRAKSVRWNKWVWVFIIVCLNIVGPILFFSLGRKEN
ncbi:PLDc N-terminal domain-containing protein [Cohnella soli]|uniref:PLDc N-terminal domain-containing protein n=1 Tax=Cohnella soli TaxID=425005 RepID=A0ABW0I2T6_9BACL